MSNSTRSKIDYSIIAFSFTNAIDSSSETMVISNDLVADKGSNGCMVDIVLPPSVNYALLSSQQSYAA